MIKDEWGNIELPGLSDEKLFKTNWNMVAHAKTKVNNLEFSKTMSHVANERNTNPEYLEKLRHAVKHKRDNTYQAQDNSRPEKKKKISDAMKGKQKTAEHLQKVAEKNKQRAKPIQTPYGQFASRKIAIEQMKKQGVVNPSGKIDAGLKKSPEQYYYL